jgi:DNA-binding MarR family transcriptional regulator
MVVAAMKPATVPLPAELPAELPAGLPAEPPAEAPAEPNTGPLAEPNTGPPAEPAADLPAAPTPRVGYLIYRVERHLRSRLDGAVNAHGVTTPEYVTLSVLRERDGLSSAQLARWAFVTPQAMNLVISALERRRLVRRRPDPRHRRVLRASVTARGLEVLQRCDRAMDAIEADMLRGLDDDVLHTVRAALSACAHSLEATRPLP